MRRIGEGLVCLFLIASYTRAWAEPVRSMEVFSRGARTVVLFPESGFRGLLNSGGWLTLSLSGAPHVLHRGRLFLAAPVAHQVSDLHIECGRRLVVRSGSALLERVGQKTRVSVRTGSIHLIAEGRAAASLDPGVSIILGPGSPVPFTPEADMLRELSVLAKSLADDPLPEGERSPLGRAFELLPGAGAEPASFGFRPLHPALKDYRLTHTVCSRRLFPVSQVPDDPFTIEVPTGTDRFGIRLVRADGILVEGLLWVQWDPEMWVLINRLEARGAFVRALLHPGLAVVTAAGGSIEIHQRLDPDFQPVEEPRLLVPAGHGFLQPSPDGPRSRLAFRDRHFRITPLQVESLVEEPLSLSGLNLIGREAMDMEAVVRDIGQIRKASRTTRPLSPDLVAGRPVLTIARVLPRLVDGLFQVLPINISNLSGVETVDFRFIREGKFSGEGRADVWMYEIEGDGLSGPRVELNVDPPSGDPARKVPLCWIRPLGSDDAWWNAVSLGDVGKKDAVRQLIRPEWCRQNSLRAKLGIALILFLLGIIALVRKKVLAGGAWRYCKVCQKKMESHNLLVGDSFVNAPEMYALRDIESVLKEDDARAFVSKVTALKEDDFKSLKGWSGQIKVVGFWCQRCKEGILQRSLIRGGRQVDEVESRVPGPLAFSALKILVNQPWADGVLE